MRFSWWQCDAKYIDRQAPTFWRKFLPPSPHLEPEEAVNSFKMLMYTYLSTQCHNPEDNTLCIQSFKQTD